MRIRALALLSLLSFHTGCGEQACDEVEDADKRDWCFHEAAIASAEQSRMEEALSALNEIQAPMVKAFATERILTGAASGLSMQQAEAMCRSLPEPYLGNCLRTWSRPHLWTK